MPPTNFKPPQEPHCAKNHGLASTLFVSPAALYDVQSRIVTVLFLAEGLLLAPPPQFTYTLSTFLSLVQGQDHGYISLLSAVEDVWVLERFIFTIPHRLLEVFSFCKPSRMVGSYADPFGHRSNSSCICSVPRRRQTPPSLSITK